MLSPSFKLRLLGTKGHRRGFEKLGQNPPAGQGADENVEQTEKWENRSGCKHKGIFFVCSDVHGSRPLWPARSRRDRWGLKQRGLDLGSAGVPAERDRCARAPLSLAISLLFTGPLAWHLQRGEAPEGRILTLSIVFGLCLMTALRTPLCIPVFHNGGGVTAAWSPRGTAQLEAGSAAAQALACIVREMRGALNRPKTPVLCNCAASNKPEWSLAKGEPAPQREMQMLLPSIVLGPARRGAGVPEAVWEKRAPLAVVRAGWQPGCSGPGCLEGDERADVLVSLAGNRSRGADGRAKRALCRPLLLAGCVS